MDKIIYGNVSQLVCFFKDFNQYSGHTAIEQIALIEKNSDSNFRILIIGFNNRGFIINLFEQIYLNILDAEEYLQILKCEFKRKFNSGIVENADAQSESEFIRAINGFIENHPLNCDGHMNSVNVHHYWKCDTEIPLEYGRFVKELIYYAQIFAEGNDKKVIITDDDEMKRIVTKKFFFDNFSCSFHI